MRAFILSFFFFASFAVADDGLDLLKGQQLATEARNAYTAGRLDEALKLFQTAEQYRPDHPGLLFNLIAIADEKGDGALVETYLRHYADMGLYSDAFLSGDFQKKYANSQALKSMALNKMPIGNSAHYLIAKTETGLVEGVLPMPNGQGVIISAYHDRQLYQIMPDGAVKALLSKPLSYGPMGMKWGANGLLYVATSALSQMSGYDDGLKDRSEVVILNPALDYKIVDHIPLMGTVGDLALAANGTLYATSSVSNEVYKIENHQVSKIYKIDNSQSLQGITFSLNQNIVYISDYSTGIHWLDIESGNNGWVRDPVGETLLGIDGLYHDQGNLIAIQNGVQPNRVLRLVLSENGKTIEMVEVLQQNHPAFNEPTLGYVARNYFYFVANSQWPKFSDGFDEKTNWREKLDPVMILKLALKP